LRQVLLEYRDSGVIRQRERGPEYKRPECDFHILPFQQITRLIRAEAYISPVGHYYEKSLAE
jgi:hypothetical protein